MINLAKEKCFGCAACLNVCPKHCISLKQDDEGFSYPVINNSACIDCNMCENVCPAYGQIGTVDIQEAFFFKAKNNKVLYESSSGGAFGILAKKILSENGIIFGATFDDDYKVIHNYIYETSELYKLQKSKYVQSDLSNCYKPLKSFLDKGVKVLFTGTPCQIHAVKKFLRKGYDNLYTADVICSGCPSPTVWESYLEALENKFDSKITSIDFRDKSKGWENFCFKAVFNNKAEYLIPYSEELYVKAFLLKLINRPSCYQCPYTDIHHLSDLTLGDLWGVEKIMSSYTDEGSSLIIANTQKGKDVLTKIGDEADIDNIDYNKAVLYNKPLIAPYRPNMHRVKFFRQYKKMPTDIEQILLVCLHYNIYERIKLKLISQLDTIKFNKLVSTLYREEK